MRIGIRVTCIGHHLQTITVDEPATIFPIQMSDSNISLDRVEDTHDLTALPVQQTLQHCLRSTNILKDTYVSVCRTTVSSY